MAKPAFPKTPGGNPFPSWYPRGADPAPRDMTTKDAPAIPGVIPRPEPPGTD